MMQKPQIQNIQFWNGNKSNARQSYEVALLQACLLATEPHYGAVNLQVDNSDYPLAEDESNVFAAGTDILVTVAGNVKFQHKQKIVITRALTKGLLGYRLLVVRDECLARFKGINNAKQLQALSIGIPNTWADAELFRHNHYSVVEKGNFDELFQRLKNANFDYTALGVNEIEAVFKQNAAALDGLSIEPSLMLYYPFPLVFYVNHSNPELAARVTAGLDAIMSNGQFERLFNQYHGDILQRLDLRKRQLFNLNNPVLPPEMADFKSTLLE